MLSAIALSVLLSLTPVATLGGEKTIVETAVENGSFTTLATALTEAELIRALSGEGPFTVFAPTDDAFAALPEGTVATLLEEDNRGLLTSILTYHVVPGRVPASRVVELDFATTLNGQRLSIDASPRGVMVNDVKIVTTDIECSNGVIHVIDAVLMPATANIVETADEAGDFGTLIAAAKAAGLVDVLTGEGPLTVLAPTDAAFAKLPEGTVASLLKPENKDQLVEILTYHVLPGRVYASDALKTKRFKTVQSSPVVFSVDGKRVSVSGANVVATDIQASNGVIHVIDSVMMPPSATGALDHATSTPVAAATSGSCEASSSSAW